MTSERGLDKKCNKPTFNLYSKKLPSVKLSMIFHPTDMILLNTYAKSYYRGRSLISGEKFVSTCFVYGIFRNLYVIPLDLVRKSTVFFMPIY